jgi:hypothetical protein
MTPCAPTRFSTDQGAMQVLAELLGDRASEEVGARARVNTGRTIFIWPTGNASLRAPVRTPAAGPQGGAGEPREKRPFDSR